MATRAPANDLQAWLAGLEPEPCAAGEGAACLLYLLDRDAELPQRATLNVVSARRRSDGSYGSVQPQIKAAHSHARQGTERSAEHTSELQSLMRTSYAVFCFKQKTQN